MARLGLGIIGAGKHGLRYVRHLTEEVDGAALAALCRRDRAAGAPLAAAHGAAFHTDWRALVEDPRVDAIVTVVPPVHNVAIAEAAARAGKPVLLEKPLATTLAEARRIVVAASAAGITAMVAQTLRFDATVAAVRAALPTIAPLHAITLVQRFEPSPLAWLDRQAESGGGILLHTGVHSIDLLRVLAAREVTMVSCLTARVLTRETEDNFVLLARLGDDGPFAHVAGSRALGGRTGLMELAGAGGHVVADHVHRWATLARGGPPAPMGLADAVPTVRDVLRAFVAAVRNRAAVPIPVEDGARAIAVVDAGYRSAARGGAPEPVETL
ncbi:MAG TPA: Gfo/Idh/MocA family oxidoreductase [Terriglobales bacterium]|nr:Gfo/Idh/MocA family oxidoreductase [Terriglobales bacterium]